MTRSARSRTPARTLINKVPEITLWFWVIKICCTTVGETAADFLDVNLGFGLTATSVVTGVLLAMTLWAQLRSPRYNPSLYWTTVALVSVFGTLVTDNLTDNLGFPLEASTVIFAVLLAAVLLTWYRSERTLSIHSIVTRRRESLYWTTIFVTFALGTATGDLMAEGLGLGYTTTGLIVAGLVALTAAGWKLSLHSVLSFWIIYILTRPLGASIGDYLSQPPSHGGLGLGSTLTSVIFLGVIVGIVVLLTATQIDTIPPTTAARDAEAAERGGRRQTLIVVCAVLLVAGTGYTVKKVDLNDQTTAAISAAKADDAASPLGDLTTFRVITQDTLDKLTHGDQPGATTRVDDLEFEWDNAQSTLKPRDTTTWTTIDDRIDTVLRELRATSPQAATEKAALTALLAAL